MREIITLQVGSRGNYLGTQFWNIQVSLIIKGRVQRRNQISKQSYIAASQDNDIPVDPAISWKAVIGVDGTEILKPRALIYDLATNFGPVPQVHTHNEDADEPPSFSG